LEEKKKRKKKIPDNYTWFEVNHPLIPNQSRSYRVAALHEDEATTIISKKFNIRVYVDDENTEINKIGPVRKSITKKEKKVAKKSTQGLLEEKLTKLEEKEGPIENKICSNCGCRDKSIGSDICPSCGTDYPENFYSIAEKPGFSHIRGTL